MIKFKKAVSKSSKIPPVVMSKKELKIYKKMDKYVTKCINKAIKKGYRYVVINNYEAVSASFSIGEYEYYAESFKVMLSDYKKELIEEGFKIKSSGLDFKISWEHGMNKDA